MAGENKNTIEQLTPI